MGRITLNPVTNVKRLEGAMRRRLDKAREPAKPTGYKSSSEDVQRRAEQDMRARAADYQNAQVAKTRPAGQPMFKAGQKLDTTQIEDRRGKGKATTPTGTVPPRPVGSVSQGAVSQGAMSRRLRRKR